jgi:hypothetical protein
MVVRIANRVLDLFLHPAGLPNAADARRFKHVPRRAIIVRLLALREAMPLVPQVARFALFAQPCSRSVVSTPHSLLWGSAGACCFSCRRLFRSPKGWTGQCTVAPMPGLSPYMPTTSCTTTSLPSPLPPACSHAFGLRLSRSLIYVRFVCIAMFCGVSFGIVRLPTPGPILTES